MKKPTLRAKRELTGVEDVRRVRERIAAMYNGDIAAHIRDTNRIVEPLIKKLKLKKVLSFGASRGARKLTRSA